MKIHHIGYLVKDISKSLNHFLLLGYKIEKDIEVDHVRNIYIMFLLNDAYRVELIQPIDKSSDFDVFMKRFRNLPYHLCYETDTMNETISNLERQHYHMIQTPLEACCINGRKVAFMQHPEIGIIELLEIQE